MEISETLLLSKNQTLTSNNLLKRLFSTEMLVSLPQKATSVAKNFVESMETSQSVCASLEPSCAMQTKENRNIMTLSVKAVVFCASSKIALLRHSENEENFMKSLYFCIDAWALDLRKHFFRMNGHARYTLPVQ